MLMRTTTSVYHHYFLCSPIRTSIAGGTSKLAAFNSTQAQYGCHCDSCLHQVGTHLPVTHYGFVKLLSEASKSSTLLIGEQLHSAITKLGLTANVFVCTSLLDVYSKCLGVKRALQLFDEMPRRNVVTWNTILYGHSKSKHPEHALEAFSQMLDAGIPPTHFSVSTVLIGCSHLEDPAVGASMHCFCLKNGFCSNVVVGTALLDMYSKCCSMSVARRLFDEMLERNVVTWTSLISGYAHHKIPLEAMLMFKEMRNLGYELNSVTYNSLLSSLLRLEDLIHGKQVHCLVMKEGLDFDSYIAVSLLTMYSKCGSSEDFIKVCSNVMEWDQVSFNSIISGFSHLGSCWEVLEKFSDMRRACLDMDVFTLASVLRAVGITTAVQEGRQTHALILKIGLVFNLCIQNGLVYMYAKCGAINDSKNVFLSIVDPDLVSWNSLISGCAQHGHGNEAIELFEKMMESAVEPDHATYLAVISACSRVGHVERGLQFFHQIEGRVSQISAVTEHYASVVDLLGRAGRLDDAESFIKSMLVKPGVSVYRALLSACQVHGNVGMAKRAAKSLFELCPNDSGTHILLSNVFAADGSWQHAHLIRKEMMRKRVRKEPGWSWIDGHLPDD